MGTGITPCPLPSHPRQESDTSVARAGEETGETQGHPGLCPGKVLLGSGKHRDERGRLSCLLVHRESSWQEVASLVTVPVQPEAEEQVKPESRWDQMDHFNDLRGLIHACPVPAPIQVEPALMTR